MDAKILKVRPQSGEFEELRFDAYDETTYVKFEDQDYLEFCGVFGGGFGSRSALALARDVAFVISLGQGYIFDIRTRALLHKTECDHLTDVMYEPVSGYFVACNQTGLFVYDPALVWSSGRVSADGITLDETREGVVYGKVDSLSGWVDFSLKLEGFEYICDWRWPCETE